MNPKFNSTAIGYFKALFLKVNKIENSNKTSKVPVLTVAKESFCAFLSLKKFIVFEGKKEIDFHQNK